MGSQAVAINAGTSRGFISRASSVGDCPFLASARPRGPVLARVMEGSAFGHVKIQGKTVLVRGLNHPGATISTRLPAPVLVPARW